MIDRNLLWTRGAALLALSFVAHGVLAQAYPARPIRFIVPQAPGSATDVVGRVIGQKLADALKQQIVVDNRAGAGGLLGTEIVAKSQPDGYTILLANISTHGVNPALYRKMPYDAVKDFAAISMAATTSNVLLVHPSVAARSVPELIAFAKAKPGQLNIATPGSGSSQHLATELLRTMAGGISTVHIPYKGTGPALTALLAGEASLMMPTLTTAMPHIASQKVRALAVTSAKRLPEMPDMPTVAETLPGFEVLSWYALVVPAGTPKPVVARLNAETAKALATPEVLKVLTANGLASAPSTPEYLAEYIKTEVAKWTKVARDARIQLD